MLVIADGSVSWVDEAGTTFQIPAPWVRANLSRSCRAHQRRGAGLLSDVTGRPRNHGRFGKSGPYGIRKGSASMLVREGTLRC